MESTVTPRPRARIDAVIGALIACIIHAGCHAQPAPGAKPDAVAATEPALLAVVQETRNGFELRLARVPEAPAERAALMSERPEVVIWRTDRPEVVTVGRDGVYAVPYAAKPYRAKVVGDPPQKGVTPLDGWVDKDGHSVIVVGRSRQAGGGTVCALYRVSQARPWPRTDKAMPVPSADDEECEKYADRHREPSLSRSSAMLMRGYQCVGGASLCKSVDDPRHAGVRAAIAGRSSNADAVAVADVDGAAMLLAMPVTMGDTPHLMAPVYLVRRASSTPAGPALKTPRQVQVGLQGRWALLAAEYSGADPVVIDLDSGRTVFSAPAATGAVWVPATP